MKRVHIKRSTQDEQATGSWWRDLGTVWMRCPSGHIGTLDDHEIKPNGIVEPSVVCPSIKDGECSFHEYVILDDWNGGLTENGKARA